MWLANVQCVEVWCPMTAEFHYRYHEQLNQAAQKKTRAERAKAELFYVMNPNKVSEM